MVPFLCVASDMNHRRPAVLRSGELSEAVRSSMAIPLVFRPMGIDSMLLYDGGIYDNFPWKPLDEEFSPDLIVGSICTAGNTPPSVESNLMDQAFMLAMQETDYTLPEGRSVTIRRGVDAGMLDFDRAVEVMDSGYADAMAAMPQILERITDRRDTAYYEARRAAFRERCPKLLFDDYKLEGLSQAQRSYIRDFVQVDRRTPGAPAPDGFRRTARQPLRSVGRRGVHDGFSPCALRLAAGPLFVPGPVPHASELPDHDRRQHLFDGLQPGLHRDELPADRSCRAAARGRALPGAALHVGQTRRAHRLLPRRTAFSRLLL